MRYADVRSLIVVLAIAVAAVAVLAAVVALAMGKGGELAETHPDHPPLPLPDDRPLVGMDAAVLRLPRGLWGYHVDVTDEALRRLAYALTERETRVAVLERELAQLRDVDRQADTRVDAPADEPGANPLANPQFAEESAPWQPPYTPAAAQRFADLQPYANPEPYTGRPYAGSGDPNPPTLQPYEAPQDTPQPYAEVPQAYAEAAAGLGEAERAEPRDSAAGEASEALGEAEPTDAAGAQGREWPHGEVPVRLDLEAGGKAVAPEGQEDPRADDEWESLGTGQKPAAAGTGRYGQWAAGAGKGEAAGTPETVEYGWQDEPADDAGVQPDKDAR